MNLLSFCLRNFKAIQNSKSIRFTPLTVFIGNNGSGKSSIIEALETFQILSLQGLDEAMHHGTDLSIYGVKLSPTRELKRG